MASVVELPRGYVLRVADVFAGAFLLMLRAIGFVLPTSVLWLLLWPFGLVRSAWELLRGRPTSAEFQALPHAFAARPTFVQLLLARTRLNVTKLMFLWVDKFASYRWFSWKVVGAEQLEAIRSGRPTILVALHYGPMNILYYWLRARGYPVAIVTMRRRRKRAWYRPYLDHLRDVTGGLTGAPNHLEAGQVWEMHDHLRDKGSIMILVDNNYGRLTCTPAVDGVGLMISTGSLQLAAVSGAQVIPCLMRSGNFFRSTLYFGEPLPADVLADRTQYAAACEQLLRQFLPWLTAAPEECSHELLGALHEEALHANV